MQGVTGVGRNMAKRFDMNMYVLWLSGGKCRVALSRPDGYACKAAAVDNDDKPNDSPNR